MSILSPFLKVWAPVLRLASGTGEDSSERTIDFKAALHLVFQPGGLAYEKAGRVKASPSNSVLSAQP